MPPADSLVQQALALPLAERAFLADQLEASLTGDAALQTDIVVALGAEVESRVAAYQRGELQAVEMAESRRSAREQLEQFRAQQVRR